MTATHMIILAVFIFLGGLGIAALQESLLLCLDTIFPERQAFRKRLDAIQKRPSSGTETGQRTVRIAHNGLAIR